ncbi:MAG: hypothetical protein FJ284_02335 [Planctomycetes bacterium]|nr:hypothetical protein [Planctomycetota bacterium]MBM4058838.1 hypothetical protein [Planctomycetota bacterium]
MKTSFVVSVCLALFAAVAVSAPAAKGPAPKCPISGKPSNPDVSVEFAGGNVWFCCEKCQAAFKGDSAKFAAKAHQQMVSTGQLTQKGCPFSGGPVKAGTELDIGGASVGFCCNNCKGKVAKAGPDEQVTMVFGNISKGFAPAK